MEEECDRRSADVSLDDFSRHVESHAVECDVVGGRKRFMMMMMQQTPALTDSKVENEIKSYHALVPSKEKQSKKEISIG